MPYLYRQCLQVAEVMAFLVKVFGLDLVEPGVVFDDHEVV